MLANTWLDDKEAEQYAARVEIALRMSNFDMARRIICEAEDRKNEPELANPWLIGCVDAGIPLRVSTQLDEIGVVVVGMLSERSREEVLKCKCIDALSICQIEAVMGKYGISFLDEKG